MQSSGAWFGKRARAALTGIPVEVAVRCVACEKPPCVSAFRHHVCLCPEPVLAINRHSKRTRRRFLKRRFRTIQPLEPSAVRAVRLCGRVLHRVVQRPAETVLFVLSFPMLVPSLAWQSDRFMYKVAQKRAFFSHRASVEMAVEIASCEETPLVHSVLILASFIWRGQAQEGPM